ncbi:MAG TPA: hypothetical protein VGB68_08005 [Pyrinomonadaceae bacterium]
MIKGKREMSSDKRDLEADKHDLSEDKRRLSEDKHDLSKDKHDLSKDKRYLSEDKRHLSLDKRHLSLDKRRLSAFKSRLSFRFAICVLNFAFQTRESNEIKQNSLAARRRNRVRYVETAICPHRLGAAEKADLSFITFWSIRDEKVLFRFSYLFADDNFDFRAANESYAAGRRRRGQNHDQARPARRSGDRRKRQSGDGFDRRRF